MTSSLHGKLVLSQGIHGMVSFEYDNETERLAATDFITEDRYKIAYQIDNGTFWVLIDESIPTWLALVGETVGPAGGDLSGNYPNPTVTDLTIASETQGSVLYFNGSNWVRLAASTDGYVLTTHSTGQNPSWLPPTRNTLGVLPADVTKAPALSGESVFAAKEDHKHNILTAAASSVGATNAEGSATSLARSDHTHAVIDLSISSQAQGDILYFNGSNWVRLAASTDGYFLQTHSTSQNPTWSGELKTTIEGRNKDIIDVKTITFIAEYNNGNSGSEATINWNNGQKQLLTLSATTVLTFVAPLLGVGNLLLRIVQDSTPRTITWPGTVKWVGGAAPTISTGSGAIDIITFYWNGTNYFGVASLNFA